MGSASQELHVHDEGVTWSLLDAVPDATFIVAASGDIVYATERAGELFCYDTDALVGRVVEDLVPESSRAVHRAHRTRYRAEPKARSMGTGLDLWARRSDGTEFPVEVSLSPLRLGGQLYTVAGVRDITERLEAEDQLRRVLRTLDASDDGVFIFDASTLQFSFVNEGAVRLAGYTHAELLTMTPLHLDPQATDVEFRSMVEHLLLESAGPLVREGVVMRRDGSELPVESTLRSAPAGRDGSQWVIMLARDISARLAAERELARSHDALREAERVVAIAEDRERIARDLHDTVIQHLFGEALNLQAAASTVHDAQRTRERIEAAINSLDRTIKEVRMAIFRLQGSSPAPGGLRGRLLDVVTDATESLGFEPRLQFDGVIESIDADVAEQMVAVLREALSNVAKHANAKQVRVVVEVDGVHVTVSVTDDGVGVPGEVHGGRGLSNMAKRAADLDGTFSITALPGGSGTRLIWSARGG